MNNCSCIKGVYDFKLESYDCRTLLYNDLSDWVADEGFEKPESYPITISRPNRVSSETVEVSTEGYTKLTPEDFGDPASWLIPDGIWKFEFENCGTLYTKHVAVTCLLQCKIDSLLAQNKSITLITEYQARLDKIKLAVKHNNLKNASKMFKLLTEDLACYNCQ